MADRLLVLGGTGMLGHAAASVLSDDFDVIASIRDCERAARYGIPADRDSFDADTSRSTSRA